MAKRFKSRSSSADSPAASPELRLFRIPGIPEIRPGNDLVKCVASAATRAAIHFEDGDILVFAQKIVSKAEGDRKSTRLNSSHVAISYAVFCLKKKKKKDTKKIQNSKCMQTR